MSARPAEWHIHEGAYRAKLRAEGYAWGRQDAVGSVDTAAATAFAAAYAERKAAYLREEVSGCPSVASFWAELHPEIPLGAAVNLPSTHRNNLARVWSGTVIGRGMVAPRLYPHPANLDPSPVLIVSDDRATVDVWDAELALVDPPPRPPEPEEAS